jgi:energy-coupling factor transport system permease protein
VSKAQQVQAGSWWLLAISLAFFASTTNLPGILAVIAVVISVPLATGVARGPKTNSNLKSVSLSFYLKIAAAVVIIRILFRVIFNYGSAESLVLIRFPQLNLELGAAGTVRLLGDFTLTTLQSSATDGLRLAAIILSIAMANLMADPRTLVRALPSAFREVGTAIGIALNLAPQIIQSLQRVKRAQVLRVGSSSKNNLAHLVTPVLEDAIDQSLALAASMDSRGFGRRGTYSKSELRRIRVFTWGALAAIVFALASLLLSDKSQLTGLSFSILGVALLLAAFRLLSKGHSQTRYRAQEITRSDFALSAISALLIAGATLGVLF